MYENRAINTYRNIAGEDGGLVAVLAAQGEEVYGVDRHRAGVCVYVWCDGVKVWMGMCGHEQGGKHNYI